MFNGFFNQCISVSGAICSFILIFVVMCIGTIQEELNG